VFDSAFKDRRDFFSRNYVIFVSIKLVGQAYYWNEHIFIPKLILQGKMNLNYNNRKDDIKMGPTELGWKDVDKIHLAQHSVQWKSVVKPTINRRFPIKKKHTLTS